MSSLAFPPSLQASLFNGRKVMTWTLVVLAPIALGVALLTWAWSPVEPTPAERLAVAATESERQLADAIAGARASTVALEYGPKDASGRRKMATGVVINNDGDVLSVRIDPPTDRDQEKDRDRTSIVARDAQGRRRLARWVAADPDTGLTLLKVEPGNLRAIAPAAREAKLGGEVFVVGNPYGLGHSVSRGHVAGLARHVEIGLARPLGGLIQVQAPFHPGDSGALLADIDGGWLGLVRVGLAPPGASHSQTTGDDDFGFAIPARNALWVADQLRTRGQVARAYLGIKFAADDMGEGAEVDGVVDNSPASRSGLKRHDRVIRLDDHPIRNPDDLTDRLDLTLAGTKVDLEVIRGETLTRLTVSTAARPHPWPVAVDPTPKPVVAIPKVEKPAVASLPREVLDRIERLERRIEELERREKPAAVP